MTSSIYVVIDRCAGECESPRLGLSRSQTPARPNALLRRAFRARAAVTQLRGTYVPHTSPTSPNGGTAFRFPPSGEDRKRAAGRWPGLLPLSEATEERVPSTTVASSGAGSTGGAASARSATARQLPEPPRRLPAEARGSPHRFRPVRHSNPFPKLSRWTSPRPSPRRCPRPSPRHCPRREPQAAPSRVTSSGSESQ